MAGDLTINRASHRQVKKRASRKCRRSGQFSSREDRQTFREIRWSVSPARKPFAIAEEFGDAKIQHPDRCEISGLPARSGEETSAGCGLAHSRTSDERFLRRAESLTHENPLHGAVDKKTAHRLAASSANAWTSSTITARGRGEKRGGTKIASAGRRRLPPITFCRRP